MDPLSLAAGTAGFVALAIQLSGIVRKLCDVWSSSPVGVEEISDIVEDLQSLKEVLDMLSNRHKELGGGLLSPKLSITVLERCRRRLQRLEGMTSKIWSNEPPSRSKQMRTAMKIAFQNDQIHRFHKVLERTRTILVLELMLARYVLASLTFIIEFGVLIDNEGNVKYSSTPSWIFSVASPSIKKLY